MGHSSLLSLRRRVGNTLVTCVALFVLIAGVLKIRDIDLFRQSLESWKLIPAGMRSVAAVGVPILEVALSTAWFLRLGRMKAAAGMLATLVAFTGVYAAHKIVGLNPECKCLGEIVRMEVLQKLEGHLLFRNGVLIALLALGVLLACAPPTRRSENEHENFVSHKSPVHNTRDDNS